MEHNYGISLNFSFKFKDKVESISDGISQKQAIRGYFGSSPFLTPDKKLLVFQKNNNQLIVALNESQIGSNIAVTAKYNISDDLSELNEVAIALRECCAIITKELGVRIEKIGSVNQFIGNVETNNSYELLEKNFVRNFMDSDKTFSGGEYKFLFRDVPNEIGKKLNINIFISSLEQLDKVNVILDINNFETFDFGTEEENILKIGQYSLDFLKDKLAPSLAIKGIKLDGWK